MIFFFLQLCLSTDQGVMLVTLVPLAGGKNGDLCSNLQLYFPNNVSGKQMGLVTRGLIKIPCHGGGSSVSWMKAQSGAIVPGF